MALKKFGTNSYVNISEEEYVNMKPEIRTYFDYRVQKAIEEIEFFSVIYNPDCGCSVDQFVMLDRYPMSKKIISQCPCCKSGCLMEITNPVIFHLVPTGLDYSLEELSKLKLDTTTRQFPYLQSYIDSLRYGSAPI